MNTSKRAHALAALIAQHRNFITLNTGISLQQLEEASIWLTEEDSDTFCKIAATMGQLFSWSKAPQGLTFWYVIAKRLETALGTRDIFISAISFKQAQEVAAEITKKEQEPQYVNKGGAIVESDYKEPKTLAERIAEEGAEKLKDKMDEVSKQARDSLDRYIKKLPKYTRKDAATEEPKDTYCPICNSGDGLHSFTCPRGDNL